MKLCISLSLALALGACAQLPFGHEDRSCPDESMRRLAANTSALHAPVKATPTCETPTRAQSANLAQKQ